MSPDIPMLGRALISCLADEATARPDTIRGGIRELVRAWYELRPINKEAVLLASGKYGPDLLVEARDMFFSGTAILVNASGALALAIKSQAVESDRLPDWQNAEARFREALTSCTSRERCEGALGCMRLYYTFVTNWAFGDLPKLVDAGPLLAEMLFASDAKEVYAAAWALVWLGECQVWLPPAEPDLLGRLVEIGWSHPEPEVRRLALWAFVTQPLASRDDPCRLVGLTTSKLNDALSASVTSDLNSRLAILVVAWYKRAPWTDTDLAEKAKAIPTHQIHETTRYRTVRELWRLLGLEWGVTQIKGPPDALL